RANLATIGARNVMTRTPNKAPMHEPVNAVVNACPALPCCASGYPSKVVATDHASPGILNRTEVLAPPNKAPQQIQDSRMMADVGFIEKVSGSRMATPLGPPKPGNTPTTMPSKIPRNIKPRLPQLSTWPKPPINALSSSMCVSSVTEPGFQRPFGQR